MTLVSYDDLAERLGVTKAVLYNWRRRGKLPEPTIDHYQPLWDERVIDKWLSDRKASNDRGTRTGSK